MVCPYCRSSIPDGMLRCINCNRKLGSVPSQSPKKRRLKKDRVTPVLIALLAVNLTLSGGIIYAMKSKHSTAEPQPAVVNTMPDIAEQTAPAPAETATETAALIPDPAALHVQKDQPETIDRYLMAEKLRFGISRQVALAVVQSMHPAESDTANTPNSSDCTFYFENGTAALGVFAQTDLPVRMTLSFKNDLLYRYALVFGQNTDKSVTASAIEASGMFTRLYAVCAALFQDPPLRSDNAAENPDTKKTAEIVFTCSEKRRAVLGIVEFPAQPQLNYCYLQYGSLEPAE